ncbi:MAG: glycosyltransferase family 2 protein [Planctomycetales bacterium]|nr:glycosyltransferase family 2 protein [Planctomycetales bacterium]
MSDLLATPNHSPAAPAGASPTSATALPGLSVVVPMFNESDCVAPLMAGLQQVEDELGDRFHLEFLLVDDGSADDTVARVEAAAGERSHYVVLRHDQNRGIAAAIETGLRAATYDVVASIDCDGSYDLAELEPMTRLLADGVDMVTASPYHPQGGVDNVPAWRLRISQLATRMYGVAMGRRMTCYTSCYRVYRRPAVVNLPVQSAGFVGVAELMCRLIASGGAVVEHPARLRSRVAGHSKMRVARASLGHLRLMASLFGSRFVPRRQRHDE